jgi:hypothetical protein
VTRTLDSVSLNAWFTAFVAGNASDQRLAARRMRPGYRPACNAWLETDPAHNPNVPRGPAYMPQYGIPQVTASKADDAQATAAFSKGAAAGSTADKYIRASVFLATVLFLIGISGHFRIRQARLGPDRPRSCPPSRGDVACPDDRIDRDRARPWPPTCRPRFVSCSQMRAGPALWHPAPEAAARDFDPRDCSENETIGAISDWISVTEIAGASYMLIK